MDASVVISAAALAVSLPQAVYVPLVLRRELRAQNLVKSAAKNEAELAELTRKLAESESFEALFVNALESASQSDAEHRFNALVSIVKRGVLADDAELSNLRLIERSIHALEPVDMRVLLVIAEGPPGSIPNPNDPTVTIAGGTRIQGLRDQIAGPQGCHEAIAANLLSAGLVEDCAVGTIGYHPSWSVTDFGVEVLVFLQAHPHSN
jgi:hypothetical protein